MKTNKKTFSAIVAAALLSAVGARAAEDNKQTTFIPYEQLTPEQRTEVNAKLKELLQHFKIDFKTVQVGLDQDGNIVIRGRTEEEMRLNPAGNPTCWTM